MIVEGLCGDETGVLYYRVRGDDAKLIKKDALIGFRNGYSDNVRDFNIISNGRFGKI